jgi:hypothetical protein
VDHEFFNGQNRQVYAFVMGNGGNKQITPYSNKPSAAQLQSVVESAAKRLPQWGARLLNRGGRTTLVQTTLSALPIHAMMSLDVPPKTLQALAKLCRGFMWKGRADISGGHCLVAWDKVTSPKRCGSLGIPNLRLLNVALRC